MLLLRLAFRNLALHPVKNTLIGVFILTGTALLLVMNCIFDASGRGLRTSLVRSLTGHFVVGAAADQNYGLFGDEMPIVGEYSSVPAIGDFAALTAGLEALRPGTRWTPLVSTLAQVKVAGYAQNSVVFGVDGPAYFDLCSGLQVLSGNPADLAQGGVFLNERWAQRAAAALGRVLVPGEDLVFSIATRNSFQLRSGRLAGVYRYAAPSEALDRVVLTGPELARAIAGYTQGATLAAGAGAPAVDAGAALSLDDLFAAGEDTVAAAEEGLTLQKVEKLMADTADRDQLALTDSGSWSFVLVLAAGQDDPAALLRAAAQEFKDRALAVRVMDWRFAAGLSALMLLAVRTIFNVGVVFLLVGAVLVIVNTLVISVLGRTAEIGTMRALGAERGFVRRLLMLETLLLTFLSALMGLAVGAAAIWHLQRRGIPLHNPLLIGLFGGDRLRPTLSAGLLAAHVAAAALIGLLAALYPVALALKIQPIRAMEEHE